MKPAWAGMDVVANKNLISTYLTSVVLSQVGLCTGFMKDSPPKMCKKLCLGLSDVYTTGTNPSGCSTVAKGAPANKKSNQQCTITTSLIFNGFGINAQ